MATKIAISASAAAVRASSAEDVTLRPAGAEGIANPSDGVAHIVIPGEGQPTAVTAQLQAAENMRVAQQAHIDAQNEGLRRRAIMESQNGVAMQHVSEYVAVRGSRLTCATAADAASSASSTTATDTSATASTATACHYDKWYSSSYDTRASSATHDGSTTRIPTPSHATTGSSTSAITRANEQWIFPLRYAQWIDQGLSKRCL